MILHLGVIPLPYLDEKESIDTYGVALILEDKYGVMTTFADLHLSDIADDMADGVAGAIENAFAGVAAMDLYAGAMSKTEQRFREFLDNREMDNLVPGVPTMAAQMGINSRRKVIKYRKVKLKKATPDFQERPSFIDTSLYRATFRSWISQNG